MPVLIELERPKMPTKKVMGVEPLQVWVLEEVERQTMVVEVTSVAEGKGKIVDAPTLNADNLSARHIDILQESPEGPKATADAIAEMRDKRFLNEYELRVPRDPTQHLYPYARIDYEKRWAYRLSESGRGLLVVLRNERMIPNPAVKLLARPR